MSDFSIGLSGLRAAQTALDVVGNNVANAATEGYHRQQIELLPVTYGQGGCGVDVAGVRRMIDALLETEMTRQESSYGQVSQELSLLRTVETMLGEFAEGGGLNATIDQFFDSLRRLAANPLESVPRNEVVSTAQTLTAEFRRLGASLEGLENQVVLDAQNVADSINLLTRQIAELNARIQAMEIGHGQGEANNLCDQRDRLITELAGLVGIETQSRENGVVDVSISGTPVVTGSMVVDLHVGLLDGPTLSVWADQPRGSHLEVVGGRLGGLLALKNELLGGLRTEVDSLVRAIVKEVNRVHVQGLGREGSFQNLMGTTMSSSDLAAWGERVTDGTFYLRVTDTATGAIGRHAIAVDVSADTLASMAAKIDAVAGLSASVDAGRLSIAADAGYTFDFIPMVLPEPTATNLTAGAPPTVSVSGLYEGEANHVFTFTAVSSGSVGNGVLQLDVRDESGARVGLLNIGDGYAAGDVIELDNGLKIALSVGDLNVGDHFEVEAFATTDTSGFLAAAGMNTFFLGESALDVQVKSDIVTTPSRIATAFGGALTDNAAALRLAAVRDQALGSLGGMTPSEYYHRIVANLGQEVALKQTRQDNVEAVRQSLQQQQSDLSSVNINDEAAQLLVYQQMFQAAAKYLSTLQTNMTILMEVL